MLSMKLVEDVISYNVVTVVVKTSLVKVRL